ncbi:MAG: KH domain-containing protein [Patescibacteria group bacterium]
MEKDQKFVEDVVKAIVDNPDKVKTERTIDEMGVLIQLTVDPEDMGKIIGKEGKTAKALRTLLRVLGAKNNARVNLKIVEPEGSTRPERVQRDEESDEDIEEEKEIKKVKEEKVLDDIPNDVLA